jgi:hypothetical protein
MGRAPQNFHQGIMDSVNGIVQSATQQISALQAAMTNASLPNKIALDQEVQNIRNQALGELGKYDSQLQSGVSGIHAADQNAIQTAASQQLSAGQAPANSFNYTTEAPAVVQGTGPAASTLPLYTYKKKQ